MPEHVLEVEGLTKRYHAGGTDVVAVDDVGFSVERNDIVGLLGANGAGKTTTLKCICGLIRPTAGTIRVDGIELAEDPGSVLQRLGAVLEGNRNVYWRMTPRENLEFFAHLHGIPARSVRTSIDAMLDRFGLMGKVDTRTALLSRGMQQKLAIACAMIKRPQLLLLDEPILGLDVPTAQEFREFLKAIPRESGGAILLSSHDMRLIQSVCHRVVILHEGRVVVDDRIDNLLGLFKARAYVFRLEGLMSERQRVALREQFDLVQIEDDGHSSSIRVELLESRKLYDIIDVLGQTGSVIESIDRKEPNLEEVFLSVVRGA